MRHPVSTTIVTALLLMLSPRPASASLLQGLSLQELCQRSPTIVRGKVVSRQSFWSGGRIYTAVTLRVNGSLRGARRAGEDITFYRLGGRVGRVVQRVLGAATFRTGERVVVFLSRRAGHHFVTGMIQGRFRVRVDRVTARTMVQPTSSSARLLGTKRGLSRRVTLRTFEARVRRTLRALPRRRP